MKKKLIVILVSLLYVFSAKAQLRSPVQWSYSVKMQTKFEGVVYLKATMDKGWHIYSVNQKKGGPEKTSFSFLPSKSYSLIGKITEPIPLRKHEPVFGIDVLYFENSVVFLQKIKVKATPFLLSGYVQFMACTDEECLPSQQVKFNVAIK